MPDRYFHLQCVTTVAKILRDEHSSLLPNEEGRATSIAADVVRADGQVGSLETFDAVSTT